MKKICKTRKCQKCNKRYPITKFRVYKNKNWRGTICQLCRNLCAQNQYKKHKDDPNWIKENRKRVKDWVLQNKEHHKNSCKLWRDTSERGYWHKKITSIKANSRVRGIECKLTIQMLMDLFEKQNHKCVLTGRILNKDCSRSLESLSVDRIDNSKSYTIDNIRLVCWQANAAKASGSDEILLKLCKDILKTFKKKSLAN